MASFHDNLKVQNFLKAALECSVYLAPTEPGLTYNELLEVGSRAGLQPGEISDALYHIATQHIGRPNARLLPNANAMVLWIHFMRPEEPEYRNPQAFDFVFEQLGASARAYGARSARLEHSVIVERAVANRIPRLDIEAAIRIMILTETLQENEGILAFRPGKENLAPASTQTGQAPRMPIHRNESRARAYPIVKDVVARRTDGRPMSAEPLNAFAGVLEKLGYEPFRLWWTQLVAEYRQASRQTSSVTVTVLAAALVEGALTFVVRHARSLNLPVFRSSDFDGEPRTWKIEKLIASAATGGDAAILDQPTRHRAEGLVQTRQRIHAGRMLSEFPTGPVDLKPEQARDAETTAELVIGHVIEWLRRYPVPSKEP